MGLIIGKAQTMKMIDLLVFVINMAIFSISKALLNTNCIWETTVYCLNYLMGVVLPLAGFLLLPTPIIFDLFSKCLP